MRKSLCSVTSWRMVGWLVLLSVLPSLVVGRHKCFENKSENAVEYEKDVCLYVSSRDRIRMNMADAITFCASLDDEFHNWTIGKMESEKKWGAILGNLDLQITQFFGNVTNTKQYVFWLGLVRKADENQWRWILDNSVLDESLGKRMWENPPQTDSADPRCAIGKWSGYPQAYTIKWEDAPCHLPVTDARLNYSAVLVCESKLDESQPSPDPIREPDPSTGTPTEEAFPWQWAFLAACIVICMLLMVLLVVAVVRRRRQKKQQATISDMSAESKQDAKKSTVSESLEKGVKSNQVGMPKKKTAAPKKAAAKKRVQKKPAAPKKVAPKKETETTSVAPSVQIRDREGYVVVSAMTVTQCNAEREVSHSTAVSMSPSMRLKKIEANM